MGLSPTHLIIVLLIALVIFGTKRLRTIGSDLGAAVKGFKSAMDTGETEEQQKQLTPPAQKDAEFEASKASSTKSNNG